MLDLGVGDKRPKKAHCKPWPWFFWLPHSPRTCCWPAHNTFIIINGNISVCFTREQHRQGFQINNLLGIFLSCNGNLVLDPRNHGKEGRGGFYLFLISHHLLLSCKQRQRLSLQLQNIKHAPKQPGSINIQIQLCSLNIFQTHSMCWTRS